MSRYSVSITALLGLFTATANAAIATPSEVSSIVFGEVSRKVVHLADHKVTLIRVRPPTLPKLSAPPTPPPVTAEEQAVSDSMVEKAYAMLNVRATVYLGDKTPVTELRWRDETGALECVAFSNVDFRYLTQLDHLETETTVYSWFPFVDAYALSEWPADQKYPIPAGINFSTTEAEYFLDASIKESKDQETTLAGLDFLHAYYQINYAALKADYEKRQVENAERERQLRENPPVKADTVIHFWPVKSRINR